MPRKPREISSTGIYHITARGVGQQIIFEDDADRRHYLQMLVNAKRRYDLTVYAWCLMDNHVHAVVQAEYAVLHDFMRDVNSKYARDFNKRHERTGHLFQCRFDSRAVEDESYLVEVIRYVLQNPARAGICPASAYPWSSFREYAGLVRPFLTDTGTLVEDVGGVKEFTRFADELLSKEDASAVTKKIYGRGSGSDDKAILKACEILGLSDIMLVQKMKRHERDKAIRTLLEHGFSQRCIARITGCSRPVVAKLATKVPQVTKKVP